MARYLIILSFLIPSVSFAALFARNQAESLVSDLAFILDKGGVVSQEVSSVSFKDSEFVRRVDVYTAPCGNGFQVFVGDTTDVESIGYGCESKERTFSVKKTWFDITQ